MGYRMGRDDELRTVKNILHIQYMSFSFRLARVLKRQYVTCVIWHVILSCNITTWRSIQLSPVGNLPDNVAVDDLRPERLHTDHIYAVYTDLIVIQAKISYSYRRCEVGIKVNMVELDTLLWAIVVCESNMRVADVMKAIIGAVLFEALWSVDRELQQLRACIKQGSSCFIFDSTWVGIVVMIHITDILLLLLPLLLQLLLLLLLLMLLLLCNYTFCWPKVLENVHCNICRKFHANSLFWYVDFSYVTKDAQQHFALSVLSPVGNLPGESLHSSMLRCMQF